MRSSDALSKFLAGVAEQDRKRQAAKDLSALFNEIAETADKVSDPDLKAQLKVAAAVGQEKLKNLNC